MQIPVQLRSAGGGAGAWYEPLVAARPGGNRTAHGLHAGNGDLRVTDWFADNLFLSTSEQPGTDNKAAEAPNATEPKVCPKDCVAGRRLLFSAQPPCPEDCVPRSAA